MHLDMLCFLCPVIINSSGDETSSEVRKAGLKTAAHEK